MAKIFDTAKNLPPYGVWIETVDGKQTERFYDDKKEFYDNTEEIKTLQEKLNAEGKAKEDAAKLINPK